MSEKRYLEIMDGCLEVVVTHLVDNKPVRAYTALMQARQSLVNRIETIKRDELANG